MPELPEVETILRGLEPYLNNGVIKEITTYRADMRIPFPPEFKGWKNIRIEKVWRRAKYIILELANGYAILIHLGMSGKLLLRNSYNAPAKHDHIDFILENNKRITLNDPRRFGLVTICSSSNINDHKLLSHLGPEPLTDSFNTKYLFNIIYKRKKPIKTLIMDNSVVVGVGNIYACESLFRSRIHPQTQVNKLSEEKVALLVKNLKDVLSEAIQAGGSTLRDYANLDGKSGYFQHNFAVYNQKKCKICSNNIEKLTQSGRTTFFCPSCQII